MPDESHPEPNADIDAFLGSIFGDDWRKKAGPIPTPEERRQARAAKIEELRQARNEGAEPTPPANPAPEQ